MTGTRRLRFPTVYCLPSTAFPSPPVLRRLLLTVVLLERVLILLRDEEGAFDVLVFEVRVALVCAGDGRGHDGLGLAVAAGLDLDRHVADGLRELRDGEVLADLGVAQQVARALADREPRLLNLDHAALLREVVVAEVDAD